jgi:hypothetical protein
MSRAVRLPSPLAVVTTSLLLVVLFAIGAAQAALSDAVVAAFRGKIVLSRAAVAAGATDKETIAKLKAAQLTELAGSATDDGQSWSFHYTAFLKKTGNVGLKLQFVSGEQDRRFAAETGVPILDVDSPVISGDLTIGESRGLERGKAYQLKLVNDKGDVVAKASAIFK